MQRRRRLTQATDSLPGYVDRLQEGGRYTFTSGDVAGAVSGSEIARRAALRRLKEKRRLVSPRRGFFVLVPLEYRSAGSPPASWFVDPLMAFLGQPYYVGLLSAAAIHGASHQKPQVFQVVTDKPTRPIEVGRVRIEFHRRQRICEAGIETVKTETGSMRVSTPETTAFDLVRYSEAAGSLDNVATVLIELSERMNPAKLANAAMKARRPDVQRLGWLLERLGFGSLGDALAEVLLSVRRPVLLRPDRPARGFDPDPRWHVIANEEVAAEL